MTQLSTMPVRAAHEAGFEFEVGELAAEDLKVVAFDGSEAISELFQFRVELCSDDRDLELETLVGQHGQLQIAGSAGIRYVHGMVKRFERTGEGSRLTYYAAEIVPVHWLLTKHHESRVFEVSRCSDMSVPGIIRKVFQDAGLPDDTYRFALERDYEKREFVVQYRESDTDFISRLMEEEGIFHFFEHTADGHCMVIGDSRVAHVANPNEAEFPYRDPNGLVAEKECVFSVRDRRDVQMGAVCLDDFDFKQPKKNPRSFVRADLHTLLEAKVLIERCRRHYNRVRPHSSPGYRPPAPEAIACSLPAGADAALGGSAPKPPPGALPLDPGFFPSGEQEEKELGPSGLTLQVVPSRVQVAGQLDDVRRRASAGSRAEGHVCTAGGPTGVGFHPFVRIALC